MEKIHCVLDSTTHDTAQGFGHHLRKKHNITPEAYYFAHVLKEEPTCFFCNDRVEFVSVVRGHKRTCSSKSCVAKTRATGTLDGVRYAQNCTADEADIILRERALARGNAIKLGLQAAQEDDPGFFAKKNPGDPAFYVVRGSTLEEAKIAAAAHIKKLNAGNAASFVDGITRVKKQPVLLAYYVALGHDEETAAAMLAKRQRTFSLETCVDKYGVARGTEIWQARQEKWQDSLSVSKKQTAGFSRASQHLFISLMSHYEPDRAKGVFFAAKNHERVLNYELDGTRRRYIYDFTDEQARVIIEYNGDYYHANPEKYSANDRPIKNKPEETAADLWARDARKMQHAVDQGYRVLTVWEADYARDPEAVVQQCLNFLGLPQ